MRLLLKNRVFCVLRLSLFCISGILPCHAGIPAAPTTTKASDEVYQTAKTDPEVALGAKAAKEVMSEEKVLTSGPEWERVNRIGQIIAAAANKYPVPAMFGSSAHVLLHFHFYVVDNPDVNAFSLPGGFVFVNTGLLKFVHSDDELAAVLAHETGHVEHHHVITLMKQQAKIQNVMTPIQLAALAMMLSNNKYDTAGAGLATLQASQLYSIARINGYSVHAEEDADHTAMMLLIHTQFSPVALYTFMVRLNTYEKTHGMENLGIYRDHPPTPQRIAAAKEVLKQLNIPIRVSTVDPTWLPVVTSIKQDGVDLAQIAVKSVLLCTIAPQDGQTAVQRADVIAKRLDQLLDDNVPAFEVQVDPQTQTVNVHGVPILTSADAAAQHLTLSALSTNLGYAIVQVNEHKQLEFDY